MPTKSGLKISRRLVFLTPLVSGLAVVLGYTNCHRSTDLSSLTSADLAEQKTTGDAQATAQTEALFRKGKIDIAVDSGQLRIAGKMQRPVQAFAKKARAGKIEAGTELLVVVNKDCASRQSGSMISNALRSQSAKPNNPFITTQAFQFTAESELDLETLALETDQDDCLEKIALNVIYSISPPQELDLESWSLVPGDAQVLFALTDPRASEQRHLDNIKARTAWDRFFAGSFAINRDVVAAVVDTGIDYLHPDLAGNMWKNAQNQYGYDEVQNDTDPMDLNNHGSHCAGLIGAVGNNAVGISGVMPKNVKLMAVRSLDANGSGSLADIVNGINYAADNGAEIISMSFGAASAQTTFRDAMVAAAAKGAVMFVAAGNDNAVISTGNPYSPAMYSRDIPAAITIGSVDAATSARSSFSNYGPTFVGLGSPGSNGILSTTRNNTYQALQGTSMATPIAAGAAGLVISILKSNNITFTNADIISIMKNGARINAGLTTSFEQGRQVDLEYLADYVYRTYLAPNHPGVE